MNELSLFVRVLLLWIIRFFDIQTLNHFYNGSLQLRGRPVGLLVH